MELKRWHFHTMRDVEPGEKVAYRLDTFRPSQEVRILGATLGLLTCSILTEEHDRNKCVELYLAVVDHDLEPLADRAWEQLKRDFLFYLQRDVYREPTAPQDLVVDKWLPAGTFFIAGPDRPVHVHVGVGNYLDHRTTYDALGCLYYLPAQ